MKNPYSDINTIILSCDEFEDSNKDSDDFPLRIDVGKTRFLCDDVYREHCPYYLKFKHCPDDVFINSHSEEVQSD